MIRIFFGEDTFRSQAAFREARETAAARAGVPVVILRDEALTPAALAGALEGQSLFGGVPPVAVERLTRFTSAAAEAVAVALQNVPRPRTLLVWEEGDPNPQGIVWKALRRLADRHDRFESLPPADLARWIRARVRAGGGEIEPAAVSRLLELCDADLWRLSTEIDKLVLHRGRGPLRVADVDALVPEAVTVDIFGAVRAIAGGEVAEALRHLVAARRAGDDPRKLFFLVVREIQHLRAVRARLDAGERLFWWDVARSLHLPRAAAESLLAAAPRLTATGLRTLFDRLVVSYYHLNSGRAEAGEVLETLALSRAQG